MSEKSPEVFAISINFEKSSAKPSRVFKAMSEMIDGFQAIDNDLLAPFNLKVEPILLLEDIQVGSLRTIIKNVLRGINDEAIKNSDWRKILGGFLLQGKHVLLNWIETRDRIENRKELEALNREIHQLAEQTQILHLPVYRSIPLPIIAKDISLVSSSVSCLGPNDHADYQAAGKTSTFNNHFVFDAEFTEEILTEEVISNKSEVLIQVKKPDYLGESMWEFKHAGHTIKAKIEDLEWLNSFQLQKIEVLPGDSLRVTLETSTYHGLDGEQIVTYYKVLKVLETKKAGRSTQLELPPHD